MISPVPPSSDLGSLDPLGGASAGECEKLWEDLVQLTGAAPSVGRVHGSGEVWEGRATKVGFRGVVGHVDL